MAQIRIEEKKSGSILPWIIGLLLLALVIWGVAEAFEEADEEVLTEEVLEDDEVVAPVAADVDDMDMNMAYVSDFEAYRSYTADLEGEMGLGHEFSHKALTLLATAAAAVAESTGTEDMSDAESKSARVMKMADEIMKDPMAGTHADKIRMSALLITEILEDVNTRAFDGEFNSGLEKLRSEAQGISASTLTLNQKEDVRSFFRQARMVLGEMS